MTTPTTEHGDYHYDLVVRHRTGSEHSRPYASDEPLEPGTVVRLEGRFWLVEAVDGRRALAKPARYRLLLRHPDGTVEAGAFRRYRSDSPGLGHSFSTIEEGRPISWQVGEIQLARDEDGEPYLELIAERDYTEVEQPPDHELEHAFARRIADDVPQAAAATLDRAESAGLSVELVALEPGEEPDWEEAGRYIDALILEELDDDLIEQCGIDPGRDPRDTWLDRIKERLREDLERFRADVDGDHDEIEEWSFRGGRIFASVGTPDDESDPDSGHGWMCRLFDSGALTAAGFQRVQRARLDVFEP